MKIDTLDKIQPVEAPPFLFTRIQQRIKNEQATRLTGNMTWALGLSFVLILAINVSAMVSAYKADHTTPDLVKTFNLMQDNNLYR
jgi:hypothetical protein